MRLRRLVFGSAIVMGTLLSGCSVGAGGYVANEDSGELASNLGTSTASYQVLDLDTGVVSQRESIADLTTAPAWRTSRMAFRRVAGGNQTTGAKSGDLGAQADEGATTGQVNHFYIAVFEVTQAQWQRLTARAGVPSTPWTAVTPANVVSGVGDSYPAWGLSRQLVEQALAAQPGTTKIALPSETQWEVAARGDTTTTFWWGDDPDEATVASRARVAETNGGGNGPTTVGSLAANPLGLYDVAGNVWELTSSGSLRGGSWHDTVFQARSANRLAIDSTTAHALVGVRPILIP